MDFLLILFIILFFYKISFKINKDYLSKEYTSYIRGILAISVVFCHISFNRRDLLILDIFNYIGPFIVGIFFFLSGYGIISRIKEIGIDKYLDKYINKRVLRLAKEYIVIWILYVIVGVIIYKNFGFLTKNIIIPHSWFIFIIEVLYIAFFVTSKIFKKNIKKNIIALNIFQILLIIILYSLSLEPCWYISIMPFGIGMLYRELENKKINNLKVIVLNIFLLAFLEIAIIIIEKLLNEQLIVSIIKNIATVCFSIIVINIGKYVQFKNPIFKFCGNISLYIYLLHGIFERLFSSIEFINNNNLLYGICVLTTTIIFSLFYKNILKRTN